MGNNFVGTEESIIRYFAFEMLTYQSVQVTQTVF